MGASWEPFCEYIHKNIVNTFVSIKSFINLQGVGHTHTKSNRQFVPPTHGYPYTILKFRGLLFTFFGGRGLSSIHHRGVLLPPLLRYRVPSAFHSLSVLQALRLSRCLAIQIFSESRVHTFQLPLSLCHRPTVLVCYRPPVEPAFLFLQLLFFCGFL